jgi:PKD repeat protein
VFRALWVGAAGFAIGTASRDPLIIQFVDRSTVQPRLSWRWDFGDGTTSTESDPSHRYERPGAYLVRLTVTGGEDPLVATKLIHVDSPGTGLATEYFADPELTTLLYRDTSPAIDFTAEDPSGPELPDDSYSVRWTGRVRPRLSENYRLIVRASEDVRLWIDGREVIDGNTPLIEGERSGDVELRAGALHDIVLELSNGSSQTAAQLLWESPSQTREVVPPASFLLPPRRRAVAH